MNLEMRETTRALVARERLLINDLRELLSRLDTSEEPSRDLKTALLDLDGIFLLVVVGEYNGGKSSLLNALLAEKVMPEGVTPTTDRVTIVSYGDSTRDVEETSGLLRRTFPSPALRELALVDTPGTNAVIKKHQELTEKFIPRADLVLFVTSADRPFTESERTFLELIRAWGKKITLVVNKLDILETDQEREQVLGFVRSHARETLGFTPQVFGVMSKQAFKARRSGSESALAETGLPELEAYIETHLSEDERLKLKLLNPLGVAQHITRSHQDILGERLALLAKDRRNLEEIERQRTQFDRDIHREYQAYLARIKTVLLEVERRGEVFFDDTIRLRNLLGLFNADRIRESFENRVIRDADKDIDLAVSAVVDWFIQQNLQLWEDVMGFVNESRKAGEERVIGEVGGRFHYDRQALIQTLREQAEKILDTYDERDEALRLADKLQNAVVQSGLMQVGGLGLGAAALAIVSSLAIDITGVVAGVTIAGLGLLVIPRRRRQAKRELHEKMQALRDGLEETLSKQLDMELVRAGDKLTGAIAPYTRFVRSELERLDSLQQQLEELAAKMQALKEEIETLELQPDRSQST
jgi:small GTP-binding protein